MIANPAHSRCALIGDPFPMPSPNFSPYQLGGMRWHNFDYGAARLKHYGFKMSETARTPGLERSQPDKKCAHLKIDVDSEHRKDYRIFLLGEMATRQIGAQVISALQTGQAVNKSSKVDLAVASERVPNDGPIHST